MLHELVCLHIFSMRLPPSAFSYSKKPQVCLFGNPFSQFCWKFWKRSVVSESVSFSFWLPGTLQFQVSGRAKKYIIYILYIYNLLTYLLTYLLTAWSRVLLEKLIGFQLVKKFLAFCRVRRF